MRLTTDENPSPGAANINLTIQDEENDNDCVNNYSANIKNSLNKENNINNASEDSLNDFDSSSTTTAVEVILHEENNDLQIKQKQQSNIKITNVTNEFTNNNNNNNCDIPTQPYVSCVGNSSSIQYGNNIDNNNFLMLSNDNDDLTLFGKLLTDELMKVNNYYTLQLAKYEISKILFKATTNFYDTRKYYHLHFYYLLFHCFLPP